jgi:hypothetical protein
LRGIDVLRIFEDWKLESEESLDGIRMRRWIEKQQQTKGK